MWPMTSDYVIYHVKFCLANFPGFYAYVLDC